MNMLTKLLEAKQDIDKTFGQGYALKNPDLVGSYLRANALLEFDETIASTVQTILDSKINLGSLLKNIL